MQTSLLNWHRECATALLNWHRECATALALKHNMGFSGKVTWRVTQFWSFVYFTKMIDFSVPITQQ